MVTAEIAVAMPAIVLLLGVVLSCGTAVVTKVQCVDAARAAARSAARGDPAGTAEQAGLSVGPSSGRMAVAVSGDRVEATCTAKPPGLGWLGVSGITVSARASALVEQP